MSSSTRASRVADAVHVVALSVGGLVLLAMSVLLIAGVFARYVLNSPIPGITELIGEGLMVALIYFSLSSAHHIRVSLIVDRLPERVQAIVENVVVAISAAVLLAGLYPAARLARRAYRSGEAVTGLISFDIWPYRVIIVVGVALTAARAIQLGRRWLHADHSGMEEEPIPGLVEQPSERDQHL